MLIGLRSLPLENTAHSDWWQSFFHGLPVDFWLAAVTDQHTRPEVDFLEQSLRLSPGATILDVPCGAGRHAIELAARGYRLTGVDLSDSFLAIAKERSEVRGAHVDWRQRDMRDLPWPSEFDAAFCFGNSFAYLDDAGNEAFLAAVARTLRPGGRFALETGVVAESVLPALEPNRSYEAGGITMHIENRYDHAAARLETTYTFTRGSRTERRAGSQRVYGYRELCELLSTAGFDEIEGFGGLDRQPYALGSQRLYLAAKKST